MRLKSILWLGALTLLCQAAGAQTTFEKTWFFNSACAENAQGSGYIQASAMGTDASIVKTDLYGDFVWGKTYQFPAAGNIYNICTTSQQSYIVSGSVSGGAGISTAYVMCIDQTGNSLWTNFGGNSNLNKSYFTSTTSDGGYISAGLADGGQVDGKCFLVKYTAAGARTWSSTYDFSGKDRLSAVKEMPGGGYIACGMVELEPSALFMGMPKGYLLLLRTDANGVPLWHKTIDVINHVGAHTKGRLGELIISGQQIFASGYVTDELNTEGVVIACDLSGNNLNIGTYSASGFCSIAGFGSLCDDGHGNLAVTGGGYNNGCNFFDVFKLQPNLDIIWSKRYQNITASWNMSPNRTIRLASDGGFIISTGSMLKLDANGEINCATWTTLQKNPCTWTEPVYTITQGVFQQQANLACNVIDTTLNIQVNCNDTSYSNPGCTVTFSASLSTTNLCAGECLVASSAVAGNPAAVTYNWSLPGGNPAVSNAANPAQICYNTAGQYQILLHAIGDCADTNITFIVNVGEINIALSDITACSSDTPILDAGLWPGADYIWSNGAQTQSINVSQSGYYSVTVSDQSCVGTAGAFVTLSGGPVIDLPARLTVCYGESVELNAGNFGPEYEWSNGGQGPLISVSENGTYTVTATNNCGQSIDSVEVVFDENCNQGEIFIPGSFTPDGDGTNDFFAVAGENITYFRMTIFNRWGELIFTADDAAQAWDGKYQGTTCQSDAYVYKINYTLGNSEERSRIGRVILYR